MKVAITPEYGPPSVLRIASAPEPAVGPKDLLIQVHATPVTAGDRRLRAADFPGILSVVGLLMFGIRKPRRPVQGSMYAGQVIAVGASVTRFSVGDDVFGTAMHGTYAERLVVSEDSAVTRIPAGFDYATAAAVPYGAGTALHFLRHFGKVQPGHKVLILGASGGVGRYAVQIAKHMGAEVTAVSSLAAHELTRSLGADHAIDHRSQDFTENGVQYDVIFDIADASSFGHSRRSLTPTGRYITLYVSGAVLVRAAWTALFGRRKALAGVAPDSREMVDELAELLEQGAIAPVIAERLPLDRIAEAHEIAESGVHGEVMVMVAPAEAPSLVANGG